MATLSEIARSRRADLKKMSQWSRALDAAQEKVEREVKRLMNRKKAVPEAADAQRVLTLLSGTQAVLDSMGSLMLDISRSWS